MVLVQVLTRFGTALLLVLAVATLLPLVTLHAESNAPAYWAFKYLAAPLLLAGWGIGLYWRQAFLAQAKKRANYWVALVLVPPALVLMSVGWALGANALLPPQQDVEIDGTVVAKTASTGSRSKSYHLDIACADGHHRYDVGRSLYEACEAGMEFHQLRHRGPLGFTYTWASEEGR